MAKRLDDRQYAALAVQVRDLREQERRQTRELDKLRKELNDADMRLTAQMQLAYTEA